MKPVEEEIQMLKNAHSRLNNKYNELLKDFLMMKKYIQDTISNNNDAIKSISNEFDQVKSIQLVKEKQSFILNNFYCEQISNIISYKIVDWNASKFANYEIKFKDRQEIYTAFISDKYKLVSGMYIKFLYDGAGKLKQLKIMKNYG